MKSVALELCAWFRPRYSRRRQAVDVRQD